MAAHVLSRLNTNIRIPLFASTLIATAALVACGGGSGASGTPEAPGTATAQSVSGDATASSTDSSLLALINARADAVRNIKTITAPTVAAPGPGFFVDAVKGNDTNAGTFAAPWKTLGRIHGIQLKTGDGIYLACGGVWRETLAIGNGTSIDYLADGVIVAGYGDCATSKAVISGADDFSSGWTKNGSIWSRAVPKTTPKIMRLFINGVAQRTAQWPNFGGIGQEYAISATTSPNSLQQLQMSTSDVAAVAGRDLVGAAVSVRTQPYEVEQSAVASASNGLIQLTAGVFNTMVPGNGYVLSDKQWMLDAAGEFYHDVANGILYMIPADAATQTNANASKIEGSVRDIVFKFADHKSPSISNISATMSRTDGMGLYAAPGAVLTSVDSSHNANAGIYVVTNQAPIGTMAGVTISASTVADNWRTGIDAGLSTNVSITTTTVTDTGTLGSTAFQSAAVIVGPGGTVDHNAVQRSGYTAIAFSDLNGTKVTNNLVSQYCVRLTDCGGISTSGVPGQGGQNSLIDSNQILDATPDVNGAVGGAPNLVVGIYLDDFAQGVTVNNNTLIGMPTGMFVHNGSNHTITANKFWLTTTIGLKFGMDKTNYDYMTGNVVRGNQFVPTVAVSGSYPNLPFGGSSLAINFENPLSGITTLTSGSNLFTNNQMVPLFGSSMVVVATPGQQMTTAGWHSVNPGEGTTGSPVTYAWYSAVLGPELVPDSGFDHGNQYWNGWLQNNALNALAAPISGLTGCTGPCLMFKAGTAGDFLGSSSFQMTPGVPHVITFTAVMGGSGVLAVPYISRYSSPYDWFVDSQGLATVSPLSGNNGDVIKYEAMFRPNSGDPARVNMSASTGTPVGFDSVSIKKVTSYSVPATSELVSTVAVSPQATTPTTVNCATLGWPTGCQVIDTNGAAVTLPTTLAAGTSKLFMRTDTSWKR